MNIFENKFLQICLLPLSYLYQFIVCIRNKFYDWQLFRSYKINCRVICVGNITVGGTGKTPVVEYLVRYLQNTCKLKVAILSRGYKRQSSGTVIVSDGNNLLVDSQQAGDEPYLLAKKLKTVPIIVDGDRVRGGNIAVEQFQPDIIILDDGFQHRRLVRDQNIVVVNAHAGFGNQRLLPAGPLREPLKALNRAHLLWIHQITAAKNWPEIRKQLSTVCSKPMIFSDYEPKYLIEIPAEKTYNLDLLQGQRILAFSGIANPSRFKSTLQGLNVDWVHLLAFPDHYQYNLNDLGRIQQLADQIQAHYVVTTEKDFVRLPSHRILNLPFFYLELELKLVEGEDIIAEMIKFLS